MGAQGVMSMTRFDELAWRRIHEPTPHPSDDKGLEQSGRPKNYEEVTQLMEQGGDWELVIADFLHEFNFLRTADFFEKEPGKWFSCEMRAWFAGMTEYLCHCFELPVPEWIEKPEYFLPEPWQKSQDDTGEPEFRRRNIGYNPRYLTRL
jgi:hypothetical protein